jgi:hypothetical protein
VNTDTDWIFETITYGEWTSEEAALRADGWDVVNIDENLDRVMLKKYVPPEESEEDVPR